MKIICAGNIKTGTKSMAKALRLLGYKVYDAPEQMDLGMIYQWSGLINHGKMPDFKAMFQHVDATTDLPASFFFEEILAAFPDAKVILMVRDEESWLRSLAAQLADTRQMWARSRPSVFLSPTFRTCKAMETTIAALRALLGSENPESSQIHLKHYRMHNERVKNTVPTDQLLVFRVTQGWKPLCDFLGHAVPDQPFPHENKKGEWVQNMLAQPVSKMNKFQRRVFYETMTGMAAVLFCIVACAVYLFFSWCSEA